VRGRLKRGKNAKGYGKVSEEKETMLSGPRKNKKVYMGRKRGREIML